MEVQFHCSVKIYPHVRAKLLALAALLCATGAIVGVQVAFPHIAPAIGCILLCGLFGYATLLRTHCHTSTHPVTVEDTEAFTILSTIVDILPETALAKAKVRTRKSPAPKAIYTNLQAVTA